MKELFHSGAPFPTNRQEGMAYTEELANGIKLWATVNGVVVPLAILLWAIDVIPAIFFPPVLFFFGGCPVVMILMYSLGCLRYLTPRECYKIVRTKLTT